MLYANPEAIRSLLSPAPFGCALSLSNGAGSIGPDSDDIIDIHAIALKALNPKTLRITSTYSRMIAFSHLEPVRIGNQRRRGGREAKAPAPAGLISLFPRHRGGSSGISGRSGIRNVPQIAFATITPYWFVMRLLSAIRPATLNYVTS